MRSALKGFTWRLVATFTTIVIVYCITGEQAKALQIGAIEFFGQICRLLLARAGLGADFFWGRACRSPGKTRFYLTSWSV
ncbi:MAG: hypothetical protein CM1200mP29_03920 [Verrucomicrobiota bacterium]|nr:MAG: hypothetical protein CM1200mP29_03920 [Verrucomicrobiota bacterium]